MDAHLYIRCARRQVGDIAKPDIKPPSSDRAIDTTAKIRIVHTRCDLQEKVATEHRFAIS